LSTKSPCCSAYIEPASVDLYQVEKVKKKEKAKKNISSHYASALLLYLDYFFDRLNGFPPISAPK
jgi:hypothetical protein